MTGTENGLLDQNKKMAEVIKRYRILFMSLLDAKQKRYSMPPERAPPPNRIDFVSIEKEEYEGWQAVQKIIEDAAYKETAPQPTPDWRSFCATGEELG